MVTEIKPGKQNTGLPFSERTLGDRLPPYQQMPIFKEGDRVSFPHKGGLILGRVTRGMTKEFPLAVLTDEPVWRLTKQEIGFWHEGDLEKARIAERTCYFYAETGLSPVDDR